jgi:hypothetical protein
LIPKTKYPPTIIPENLSLIDGNVTISAHGAYYLEFYVEGGSFNILVLGTFTVLTNNPARVYLSATNNTDPNGPYFSPYYDSGYTYAGNINATLPDTTNGMLYSLVFNNQNSQTGTTIAAKVSLSYGHLGV